MVLPTDLKWADAKSLPPGAKVAVIEGPLNEALPFTFRVNFPADYKLPAHWHPAIEHVTVLSGTYNFGTGDKFDKEKTKALPAGSTVINQPKTNHFVWTSEETVIQVHGVGPWDINYVNPADDPRKKIAPPDAKRIEKRPAERLPKGKKAGSKGFPGRPPL